MKELLLHSVSARLVWMEFSSKAFPPPSKGDSPHPFNQPLPYYMEGVSVGVSAMSGWLNAWGLTAYRYLNKHSIHTSHHRHRMEAIFCGSWLPGTFIQLLGFWKPWTNQVRVAAGLLWLFITWLNCLDRHVSRKSKVEKVKIRESLKSRKSKVEKVKSWESQKTRKSKVEKVKSWESQKLRKSTVEKVKSWESQKSRVKSRKSRQSKVERVKSRESQKSRKSKVEKVESRESWKSKKSRIEKVKSRES